MKAKGMALSAITREAAVLFKYVISRILHLYNVTKTLRKSGRPQKTHAQKDRTMRRTCMDNPFELLTSSNLNRVNIIDITRIRLKASLQNLILISRKNRNASLTFAEEHVLFIFVLDAYLCISRTTHSV